MDRPASRQGGVGSIPDQSMWNVCWTKPQWDRFFSVYFGYRLSVSFHQYPVLPLSTCCTYQVKWWAKYQYCGDLHFPQFNVSIVTGTHRMYENLIFSLSLTRLIARELCSKFVRRGSFVHLCDTNRKSRKRYFRGGRSPCHMSSRATSQINLS